MLSKNIVSLLRQVVFLEFTALLVQSQYWKDSQPLGKIEGWRGWQFGRLDVP